MNITIHIIQKEIQTLKEQRLAPGNPSQTMGGGLNPGNTDSGVTSFSGPSSPTMASGGTPSGGYPPDPRHTVFSKIFQLERELDQYFARLNLLEGKKRRLLEKDNFFQRKWKDFKGAIHHLATGCDELCNH